MSKKKWQQSFEKETANKNYKNKKRLYNAEDLQNIEHLDSFPGEFPYLRGPYASMYAGKPWTIRQYAGFSSAEETNKFFLKNLKQGQKGLSVAFDLATHRGYDSDSEKARSDVGKAGVAIDSVEDMKILFKGIPLDKMSVSMTMNGAVIPILANFIVAAKEQNVKPQQLTGTIQNDILKEFMVRNTYIYPPTESMRICSNIIYYMANSMPKFNAISISGYHMQEAGATTAQELAFTLANGLEYVRSAISTGLRVDDFAPRLSFFFGIGMDFFAEVAKLRAARVLWAKLMQKHFSPKDAKSCMLRVHCQTSGVSLTAQDPYNNVVRTTIEALAAVFGGTQSLHTNALDEAVALPTDFSARIARNTQLIMQLESGVSDMIDPLAGSYYLEKLTSDMIAQASDMIEKIEKMGGMTKAIITGYPKAEIEKEAITKQAKIDSGEKIIVGVNKYALDDNSDLNILEIDSEKIVKEQIKKLKSLRSSRDNDKVNRALQELTREAKNKDSLKILDVAIEAAEARATVGEISNALEEVFGRFEQSAKIVSGIYDKVYGQDKAYSDVKNSIKDFKIKYGRKPKLMVAKLGQDGHDRGSRVIASAFSDMGFEIVLGSLFQTPEEAGKEALEKEIDAIGISSLAGAHLENAKTLIETIDKDESKRLAVIIGGVIPSPHYQQLKQLGVDAIFGPGSAVPFAAKEVLAAIIRHLESNRPLRKNTE